MTRITKELQKFYRKVWEKAIKQRKSSLLGKWCDFKLYLLLMIEEGNAVQQRIKKMREFKKANAQRESSEVGKRLNSHNTKE